MSQQRESTSWIKPLNSSDRHSGRLRRSVVFSSGSLSSSDIIDGFTFFRSETSSSPCRLAHLFSHNYVRLTQVSYDARIYTHNHYNLLFVDVTVSIGASNVYPCHVALYSECAYTQQHQLSSGKCIMNNSKPTHAQITFDYSNSLATKDTIFWLCSLSILIRILSCIT